MRLALFTDTYEPEINGAARTLGRWVRHLEQSGVQVAVFAPQHLPAADAASPGHRLERFFSLSFFLYPECSLVLPDPLRIRRSLETFRPTLVHVATPFSLGLCGVHYARQYGIPSFASYHTNFDRYLPFYNLQWMVKMLDRYMRWFHRDFRRVFVPSRSTLHELILQGWPPRQLDVWSRGINSGLFHPGGDRSTLLSRHGIDEGVFVVLYAGRLAPEKSVGTAVEAFDRFRRDVCANALLVLAGDGPDRERLQRRCEQAGIPARFLGFTGQRELRDWYAAADLFLFPSSTETFGNVVLEAMACGAVPVVSELGGVTDIVEHGVTGLRCRHSDPASFLQGMTLLYREAGLRREMRERAAAYAAAQTWDAIFHTLVQKCAGMEEEWQFSRNRHMTLKRNRVDNRP